MSQEPPETLYLDAILHPHRSLPPKGFLAVMLGVGAVSFCAGFAFLLMGAWPVFGFFGLDVALIYWAFRMNYRAGRMIEHVRLTDQVLDIRRVHPSGKVESWQLEPTWAQARMVTTARGRTLRLRSRERWVELGRFMTEDERESFATAFAAAQHRRRDGMVAAAQQGG